MLTIQTPAPAFTLKNQDGEDVSLEDFRGKYVVLYFYPKDDTPGCTTEACAIRDSYAALQEHAVILGVSSDSVQSHKQFAEKYHLPFLLLSDTERPVIKAYQSGGMMTKRVTYLINPQGVIVKTYPTVTPASHAQELLQDLATLTS